MPTTVINHQSIELNWANEIQVENPKTLVLGSFNPFANNNDVVDYYYGRTSNYFWRTTASLIEQPEKYFFDLEEGLSRKIDKMNDRFCCLDVIDSIEIETDNEDVLNRYIADKVFTKFADSVVWLSKTKYKNEKIHQIRTYNYSILNFLEQSTSIEKVIHTMGKNRIIPSQENQNEFKIYPQDFNHFFTEVLHICQNKNITFISQSYSPSGYAVRNGYTNIGDLQQWLLNHLNLENFKPQ